MGRVCPARGRTAATATKSTTLSASTASSNMSATGRSTTRLLSPRRCPFEQANCSRRWRPDGARRHTFLAPRGSCGHDLRSARPRRRHDALRQPGLQHGAREMLDCEVERIVAMGGVDVKLGVRVGRDVSVEQLERDYDAIFWGVSAISSSATSVTRRARRPAGAPSAATSRRITRNASVCRSCAHVCPTGSHPDGPRGVR